MEKNFYHSDFEELIKEKADQYKMYPSEKVWKGIDRSLRTRRRWYWTGFVLLLSGVSYFAITELVSPVERNHLTSNRPAIAPKPQVTTDQLIPFSTELAEDNHPSASTESDETVTSDLTVGDSGSITASFEIPLKYLPGNSKASSQQKAAFLISGLEPLGNHEEYKIELSWPVGETEWPREIQIPDIRNGKIILHPVREPARADRPRINWFEDQAGLRIPVTKPHRIKWQLAFSPTVNYRKLTGGNNAKLLSNSQDRKSVV